MKKSFPVITACSAVILITTIWYGQGHYEPTEQNYSEIEETVEHDHDHEDIVEQEQKELIPVRNNYNIKINDIVIKPMSKLTDEVSELVASYYVNEDQISRDLNTYLVPISSYIEWMDSNISEDGTVPEDKIENQPQYRMLMGGQISTGGYVSVFTCNLTDEEVLASEAPIIGWIVLGDDSTSFDYNGLQYMSPASDVDLVLGTDYELQSIDSEAGIYGRIYTYEDGSTLTCDMTDDLLLGLVYSENIFKYSEMGE